MINIEKLVCNMLQENCYIVSDETDECVIIDCGAYFSEERKALKKYISDHELHPVHLLCTHGHVDHNFGIDTIYEEYGLQPKVHQSDADLMEHLTDQAVQFIGLRPQCQYPALGEFLSDGDKLTFGNHTIQVIHTPGHSKGSVCFLVEDEGTLFTGDTLFYRSIGRTDLAGGSMMQIIQSLRLLAQMSDDIDVLPGHGPRTTMGDELKYNPFLDR